MIAQGTLLDCAVDSASPSSWRTRPRLGRPESTSMLARLVRRSWVLPDLGDVRADAAEALELAGHVDDRIAGEADPARAAAGLQLHLEAGEGLAGEQGAAERAVAAQRRGQRMADQLAGRAAEQGGHPRGDVDDPVLGIDLPQPADAAMLIFLEQQPDRFGLGADVGDGLELVEGPAGQPGDSEDGDRGDADDGRGAEGRVEVASCRDNKRSTRPRSSSRSRRRRRPAPRRGRSRP